MAATLTVAEVLRTHWQAYRRAHPVAAHPARVIRHLLECRTAALGGHLCRCEACGRDVPLYNSCRDRHCPTCQTVRKQRWLEARRAEILPVPYFHVVFPLPHALHPLIGANRRRLLAELFGAVNWVLQHFAADPQWKLQGQLGFVAVLHTWTQKLLLHDHLHCLVPGGAWDAAAGVWRSAHRDYLFGKTALAQAFQARFIRGLQSLRRRGKLQYTGEAAALAQPGAWNALIGRLWQAKWIVYPKATGRTPEQALDYLARYTHKVAIGNHRLVSLDNGQVRFSWRDRAHGNVRRELNLSAEDFIGRFLLHILPPGFVKVRFFGWLGSKNKATALSAIRAALGAATPAAPPADETPAERILRLTGVDVRRCPHCGQATLVYVGLLPRTRDGPA